MRLLACIFVSAVAACGGGAGGGEPTSPAEAAGAEPRTFAEQVASGQKLYGTNCASCHGTAGEGPNAPRVVGLEKGALPLDPPSGSKFRKTQFKTAADVAGFVVKNMPPNAGGSLKESEYWSILAFDLHANGVDLPAKLEATNAKDVVLHK
jgi:mono/diheme cytochrome c family protein